MEKNRSRTCRRTYKDWRNFQTPSRPVDEVDIRRRIGMVFQGPNPFPKSIYDNVACGPRLYGMSLSGGQPQRLCIARAIAVQPEVNLMDEPASALDPIATLKIEELMQELKKDYTIVIVTHNMQQVATVSDSTAMMMLINGEARSGTVIEYDDTNLILTRPKDKRTEEYVTVRFG